ncbi:hypothetical protein HPB50_026811 [Hyalomma asiaticum]|uniref:Uncharacterized protein n=1 Tax=Hyalomma asiaticum TaxID=266040 RepID=A0ACB7S6F3_HYAAI|nr:hypothetical protein HPB50_026811 [Hyalomma asiaticum]
MASTSNEPSWSQERVPLVYPPVMSRKDPLSLGPSVQMTTGYTYVVRGFGCPFLEMRAVTFVHQMSSVCICAFCGAVPASTRSLPCGHIMCDRCRDLIIIRQAQVALENRDGPSFRTSAVCPVDMTPISEVFLYFDPIPLHHVPDELVLCLNADSGCTFQGKLRELSNHCSFDCPFDTSDD